MSSRGTLDDADGRLEGWKGEKVGLAACLLYANGPRSCQCSFSRPHGRVASSRKTLSCEPFEILSLSPNVVTSRRACRADWCSRPAVDTTSTGSALSRTELVRGISDVPAPEVIWWRSTRGFNHTSRAPRPTRTAETPKIRNAFQASTCSYVYSE